MHKPIKLGLLLLLGLVCLAPSATRAGDLEQLRAASDTTLGLLRSAFNERDSDRALSVLTEDGAIISTDGRVLKGYLKLKTSLTALFFMSGEYEISVNRYTLNLIDSVGYETGAYTLTEPKKDGTKRLIKGQYTLIWKKEGRAWKIHRAIGLR